QAVSATDLDALVNALAAGARENLDFGGTRSVRVVNYWPSMRVSGSMNLRRWHLEVSVGQHIYLNKLGRTSKEDACTPESNRELLPTKGGSVRTPMRAPRAAGVKLTVARLQAAADFYGEVLGVAPIRKTSRFVSFGPVSLVEEHYAAELSGGAVT